jgi:hypothetical protein
MNKSDFEKLADMRVREVDILLNAGEVDGAYYLAGYAGTEFSKHVDELIDIQ